MEITQRIEMRHDVKAISIRLTGDYQTVNYAEAWNKLGKYCLDNKLSYDCPDAEYINIYHDNPATTPASQCRVDVCIAASFVANQNPSSDIEIITVYGGRFLVYRYQGPYDKLGEVNAKIYSELLPKSGKTIRPCGIIEQCQMFEKYLNDPETVTQEELITELWIPIE